MRYANRTAPAFTMVEILVVILLISLLAVFVVPQYMGRSEEAKRGIAKSHMALLEERLAAFQMDCGRYPEQSEGLKALVEAPPGLTEKWRGPYCKASQLKDPWGNAFDYRRPGTINPEFDLISYGADGKQGGEGNNADLYND